MQVLPSDWAPEIRIVFLLVKASEQGPSSSSDCGS